MIQFGGTPTLRTLGLISSVALLIIANAPVRAQTAEEQERSYRRETMEQALQTKERFDLYGLHFDSDKATIQPESKSLLDDIATSLKNFPDWRLQNRRTHGFDRRSAAQPCTFRWIARLAIKAALVDRGVDPQRLGDGRSRRESPIASNATPEGRALNRRVELDRITDSAEAKRMLKAMSDFLGAQKNLSFSVQHRFRSGHADRSEIGPCRLGNYNALPTGQDSLRRGRGGFADVEVLYDGKTLTFLGKNANLYHPGCRSGHRRSTDRHPPGQIQQTLARSRSLDDQLV